jgi:hypothetical protein
VRGNTLQNVHLTGLQPTALSTKCPLRGFNSTSQIVVSIYQIEDAQQRAKTGYITAQEIRNNLKFKSFNGNSGGAH